MADDMSDYRFTNKLRAKHFYKFLRKNHIFEKWFMNVLEQHPYTRGVPAYHENNDILQLLDTCRDIDHSFCWASTPQGHAYWSSLQQKLRNEYNLLHTDLVVMKTFTNC